MNCIVCGTAERVRESQGGPFEGARLKYMCFNCWNVVYDLISFPTLTIAALTEGEWQV